MHFRYVIASLAGASALTFAPPALAEPDQVWAGVFASGTPVDGSRLLLWFDGHARYREGGDELDVSIVRPGVGWRVDDGVDVYAGYARVTLHRDGGDLGEDRFWQQALYPLGKFGGATLSGRTRLEQRWRETGDDTGWRLRQFVRLGVPIEGGPFSIVVWDEVFLGLNDADWGQASGYDQNRLFLGAAWRVNDRVRLEGGYLNQDINGARDERRDNIAVSLFTSF
jgi:hypothetical protein